MMQERIIILGAGESGVGAALLAKSKGYDVFVSDFGQIKEGYRRDLSEAGIAFEEKGHSDDLIDGASLVIKSPGIPETAPVVRKAIDADIEVIDELEFAYRFNSKPIIAITGSNGKTTTTLLTHHLLKESGINAGLAGNVGFSLARQVVEDKAEVYVVEM
ncbi:MAG: UDP-N-acetylmuramoyl-L-alanine--D-glutamate ligase, partial [Cyclobacteriaceae bacterium]|nr:UDP-N-acetylmuramoyl-L-alanine--D-glutamate ligase [Cyclobacteriaceae bacterium]